ncbi:hypothetical protein MK489_06085 [Myxococcota bacterium]|nr:hypothetical protein [Myxococcota bacterium]
MIRRALILASVTMCLSTALVSTSDAVGPATCARFARQIQHYEGMVERSQALENELWSERTQAHVDRLRARAEPHCPDLDNGAAAQARAFAQLVKVGAEVALRYFTFGAF